MIKVWTVGHSNHDWLAFEKLIAEADINAVADVRSRPISRFAHFNRAALKSRLAASRIEYLFLGLELGGRPGAGGTPDYEAMAKAPLFLDGLSRVEALAGTTRLVLLCAEHEPLACHRCLLVGRRLVERGVEVAHLLRDGRIEPNAETEERLLRLTGQSDGDLLRSRANRLAWAYRRQSHRLAGRP